MRGAAATIIELGTPRRVAMLLGLSLLVAASEAAGFLLLVPLFARIDGDAPAPTVFEAPLGTEALLALFVLFVTVRAVADLFRALAAQALRARVIDGLRMRAFTALVGAEWRKLSTMSQSANRALIVSTIDRVGHATQLAADGLRLGLSLAALAAAAFAISPLVALAATLAAALVTLAHAGLRRRAAQLGEALTRKYETIYLRLEQSLDALRLIKSFGRERRTVAEVEEGFAGLRDVERAYVRDSALARAALHIVGALLLTLLVWCAHVRWGVGLAALLPLIALCIRALPLLGQLQASLQQWRHEAASFTAAQGLIREAEAAAEPPSADAAPRLRREILLDGVALAHTAGRAALRDIDARIPGGAITVLTGPSGAGKSTLADLVGGLLPPDAGRIAIDGTALEGGARAAWRSRVAYVQQEPVLFAGSVRDNLLWAAPDASEQVLRDVLSRAAAEFVLALPGGLDCDLGAAGKALSGGERQRIALARALLREPDLLILDEATSALDDDGDRAIASAVAALAGRVTVLVIGHRGALTRLAQHRITLAEGRIASG